MRKIVCCFLVLGLVAGVGQAESLRGGRIIVAPGGAQCVPVPVSVPYDGPAPRVPVRVHGHESGKVFGATVRDGALVFVPDDLSADAPRTYDVKVGIPLLGRLRNSVLNRVVVGEAADPEGLDVEIDGEAFTTYYYSNDNKKPFLWPVLAEGGVTVTRDWPMGPEAGSKDHVHQKSMWTSYGDVNGVDCWGEGGNSGYEHTDAVTHGSGAAYGWIAADNTWQDKDHKPVLREEREYRFYATPASGRLMDLTVTFTAAYGKVLFGDTKEGGILAFRIRDEMRADRGGVIANALGARGESDCWGQPSAWCDYAGMVAGAGVRGIAVFDNPGNLRHPSRWHVRDYGLNGANCFGLSYFTRGEENGDFTLESGKSLTFRYRVLIHSGDVDAARVDERYSHYANAPEARWAE